jgi:hypothetical protein
VRIFKTNHLTTEHLISTKLVTLLSYQLSAVRHFVFLSKRKEAVSAWDLNNEPSAVDKTVDNLFAVAKSLI